MKEIVTQMEGEAPTLKWLIEEMWNNASRDFHSVSKFQDDCVNFLVKSAQIEGRILAKQYRHLRVNYLLYDLIYVVLPECQDLTKAMTRSIKHKGLSEAIVSRLCKSMDFDFLIIIFFL